MRRLLETVTFEEDQICAYAFKCLRVEPFAFSEVRPEINEDSFRPPGATDQALKTLETAVYGSTLTGANQSQLIAGYGSTETAGDRSTLIAGYGSTGTSGSDSSIIAATETKRGEKAR
nr:hypothetical protein [Pseudomonas sp. IB20]